MATYKLSCKTRFNAVGSQTSTYCSLPQCFNIKDSSYLTRADRRETRYRLASSFPFPVRETRGRIGLSHAHAFPRVNVRSRMSV